MATQQLVQRWMNLPGTNIAALDALINAILPYTIDGAIYRVGPMDMITGITYDGTIVNGPPSAMVWAITANDAAIIAVLQQAQTAYNMSLPTWSIPVGYGV